jgi:hypothetical protein
LVFPIHYPGRERGEVALASFGWRDSGLKRRARLLESAAKIRDIVEGFTRQRLGHVTRRAGFLTKHDDPRVVIIYRDPSVILGALDLTDILSFQ